jgi:hypothetical protein
MRLLRPALAWVLLLALMATPASARTVHFGGRAVDVPNGWPVLRLAQHPRMCVRLDRRAVYLGRQGANQRCPSNAIGRRRAILIVPAGGARGRASASALAAPAPVAGGSNEYTGLGFDACATPSARTMGAWASSPYRAIGVYIGGANRACSQPNLTPVWVEEQVAAGWHLIPTYVGLQAPTSSCSSCAKLSAGRASVQGAEAAEDAVEDAAAAGMGPGSPLYFDMEAYTRTSSASTATLQFLSAWTTRLHELGYVSGAYSSSSSGIADLAHSIGGSYTLPDNVWMANWNGSQNTLDPYLSTSAWPSHQRIHQFRGGHNETYGLMTINIDGDFVEGATVGSAVASERPVLPPLTVKRVKATGGTVSVWVRCGWAEGEECPGRIVLRTQARLPLRAPHGAAHVRARVVRLAVGKHLFHLAGGKSHTFRLALDSRGKPLLERRGLLRAQMLVAIPGSRATRAVQFRR